LVYQFPAVVSVAKVTLVISPLIALIKDQLDHLAKINIVAHSINSRMSEEENNSVISDLLSSNPTTKLLYVTPEKVSTRKFQNLIDKLIKSDKIACIVIDEAHCLSEWGHEFRPDYRKLGMLREKTGTVPFAALTATASRQVTQDIASTLRFRVGYKTFKLPCFRSNLFYDVRFKNISEVVFKCITVKTSSMFRKSIASMTWLVLL
jgi:ATP-dependent DNA helicase Q5